MQFQGVGQGRAALVHHQRDTLAREASPVEQPRDAPEAGWQLVAVGDVARVDVVAQAQTVLAVDAAGGDDVVVDLIALLLADDGGHSLFTSQERKT